MEKSSNLHWQSGTFACVDVDVTGDLSYIHHLCRNSVLPLAALVRDSDEADISSAQSQAHQQAWISGPHGYQEWPEGDQCASPQGTSSACRVRSEEVTRFARPCFDCGWGTGRRRSPSSPTECTNNCVRRNPDAVQKGEEEENASPRRVYLPFPCFAFAAGNRGTEAPSPDRGAEPAQAAPERDRTHRNASAAEFQRTRARHFDPRPSGGL